MKLTDAVIKNINHQDKDQFFSMQGTEGLTLVVYKYPSTSKTWFYQYRPKGKNSLRLKVGTYEELGINKAVSRAKKISNEIFSGKDPYAARQSVKGENTLGEQIKESYKTILTPARYRASTLTAMRDTERVSKTVKINTNHNPICFSTIDCRVHPTCWNNRYHTFTWKNIFSGFVKF